MNPETGFLKLILSDWIAMLVEPSGLRKAFDPEQARSLMKQQGYQLEKKVIENDNACEYWRLPSGEQTEPDTTVREVRKIVSR